MERLSTRPGKPALTVRFRSAQLVLRDHWTDDADGRYMLYNKWSNVPSYEPRRDAQIVSIPSPSGSTINEPAA